MHDRTLSHYLKKHAEAEVELLGKIPRGDWQACVVIPAYNETPGFLDRFYAEFSKQKQHLLLILVVNRPDTITSSSSNENLIKHTQEKFGQASWHNQTLSLHDRNNVSVLLVDRNSKHTVPAKQGVGLARKIGCDLAAKLFELEYLKHGWVYSSDADTWLPENYFDRPKLLANTAATVFEFSHETWPTPTQPLERHNTLQATQLYEAHLRLFKNGLAYAGSPYAFYTLGSTLAISIPHYCAVRGFPKRVAGEDFYLLNKLAKLGHILFCPEIHIKIQPRLSQRVPFGTGPAVQRICARLDAQQPYLTYNPKIYEYLRAWLQSIDLLWQFNQESDNSSLPLQAELQRVASAIDLGRFLRHARQHARNQGQFHKQFHQWFDGFMTLKFIHFFQQHGCCPVPLHEAEKTFNELNHD